MKSHIINERRKDITGGAEAAVAFFIKASESDGAAVEVAL